jgi:hypothetical protein
MRPALPLKPPGPHTLHGLSIIPNPRAIVIVMELEANPLFTRLSCAITTVGTVQESRHVLVEFRVIGVDRYYPVWRFPLWELRGVRKIAKRHLGTQLPRTVESRV